LPKPSSVSANKPGTTIVARTARSAAACDQTGRHCERLRRGVQRGLSVRHEKAPVSVDTNASLFLGGRSAGGLCGYARDDADEAAFIADELEQTQPGVRLFVDRKRLNPGSSWQHEIFDALDASNRVLALYSPAYVRSKVCKEEFNIAWTRGRELDRQVLFPVCLFTAPLPTYMKLIEYRPGRDPAALAMAHPAGGGPGPGHGPTPSVAIGAPPIRASAQPARV
jgi:hypothetical protein